FNPPGHVVKLVVLVIYLAVQQLKTDRHLVLFRKRLDSIQTFHAILQPLLIGETAPVSRKGDDVGPSRFSGAGNEFPVQLFKLLVILLAIESVGNCRASPSHGADEAILLENCPLLGSIDE